MARTKDQRIADADEMASRFLAAFNELDEAGKGHTKKARELYAKADRWLHKLNTLLGNA